MVPVTDPAYSLLSSSFSSAVLKIIEMTLFLLLAMNLSLENYPAQLSFRKMQRTYLWQATENLRFSPNITGWPIFSEPIWNELSRLSELSAEFWSCITESKAAVSSNPQSKLIHLLQFSCVWQVNLHLTYCPLYSQLHILLVNWQLNNACWNIHRTRVFEIETQKHWFFSLKCYRTKTKQKRVCPPPKNENSGRW